jgi:O-antigen/teichoic acid export membrane protein
MTAASYAVWVLVLQTAAYASYLNFGLQTAVGRYVAYANEKMDFEQRDSVFSTAFAGLCCAAFVALVCLAATTLAAPLIFPSVPHSLIPQMRLALAIVGFAMVVDLPSSAWTGVFLGMARYEIPALTVGGARLLSACGVIAAALGGRSLVLMAGIIATANLLSNLAQYVILRRMAPDIHFRPALIRRSTVNELTSYCFGLSVMSFAMLLITGFDLLLVGRFSFSAVAPYSVCATVIVFIAGLVGAIVNVIMPHAAALHARREANTLGELVISSTRMSVLLLVLIGMPLLIYAGQILRFWIGPQYVASGTPLLIVLIIANIIRLIGLPYATVLVAAGQQNYIKISPLAEGISNFIASVILGWLLGAIGVALGTLLGSIVSIATHLLYSMARTKEAISLSRRHLVFAGVLFPVLWTSPLLASAAASLCGVKIGPFAFATAMFLSLLGAGFLLFRTHGTIKQQFGVSDCQEPAC